MLPLRAGVVMVNELSGDEGVAFVFALPRRHRTHVRTSSLCFGRGGVPPDDLLRVDVDDEHVDEPTPGAGVGEVRHPPQVGRGCGKSRSSKFVARVPAEWAAAKGSPNASEAAA